MKTQNRKSAARKSLDTGSPIPSASATSTSTIRHLLFAGATDALADGSDSNSCTITVTLDAAEICGCGSGKQKISGTATASNPLCQVTVPIPNQLPVSGTGSVTFSYFPSDDDLGATVAVWAYGSEGCTAGVAYVDVLDVDFEIEDWDPTVEDPANVDVNYTQRGTPLTMHVPYLVNRDRDGLFEAKASVTIKTKPASTSDIADACCAEWVAEIIQNVTRFGVRRATYANSTWTTALGKLPGLDADIDGDTVEPFTKANEKVSVNTNDTPGFSTTGIWVFDNYTWEHVPPNPMILIEDDVSFITWLTVKNTETNERRFLKWVRWTSSWALDVTVPAGAKMPAPLPTTSWRRNIFNVDDQGDGDGNVDADFNAIKPQEIRDPAVPPQP